MSSGDSSISLFWKSGVGAALGLARGRGLRRDWSILLFFIFIFFFGFRCGDGAGIFVETLGDLVNWPVRCAGLFQCDLIALEVLLLIIKGFFL